MPSRTSGDGRAAGRIALRRPGFREIPCYNNSPPDTTLFFQLDL